MLCKTSVAAAAISFVLAPGAGGQTATGDQVQHFARNISAYLVLRERAVSSAPDLAVTGDSVRLDRTEAKLGEAIRAARWGARQGDIFTADVAAAFRRQLTAIARAHALRADDIVRKIDDDVTRSRKRALVVNGRFVWNRGSEMPVEILDALPDLPAFLAYEFVDRNLVLVDVDADLIVDILPDALRDK